ncbi:MAG TPA: leucyl aminopeptidase family protein [Pedomonas sp.]|uniref:leucyl aminopeptidase family protein n=1 Tax=Pedomonas sp. TaxID=2976421 RepID=UPI002F3FB5DA
MTGAREEEAIVFQDLVVTDSPHEAIPLWVVDDAGFAAWTQEHGTAAARWLETSGFKPKPGELTLLPGTDGAPAGAVLGVKRADALGPWDLAPAAAKLPAGHYRLEAAAETIGQSLLGWMLAHYRFDRYKSDARPLEPRVLMAPAGAPLEESLRLAQAVALVRDLVNTPASDMGPEALANAVRDTVQPYGASVRTIVGDDLIAANFPAVHAVGRASAQAPRLIDVTWGDETHPRLTLVGKGVTFDTGGLDIKPSSAMLLMKKDMGGAAHALALARLVMEAKLPVRLRLLIPAVENAVSGNAFRPGDVLATRKGLSVEVGNTDAEGRLILCDALALACEDEPDLLLDFATLTGAARVALGPELPALFTPDDDLAADLARHAAAVADPLWRLPLWEPYRDMLNSTVADINNAGEGGFAGAITAALFLQRFVTSSISWAHFDVYAWSPQNRPARPKGGEAMILRACYALLASRYA